MTDAIRELTLARDNIHRAYKNYFEKVAFLSPWYMDMLVQAQRQIDSAIAMLGAAPNDDGGTT
jgi:hypothetical protein